MRKLEKYKGNLTLLGNWVYSYSTHVATIEDNSIRVLESNNSKTY